MKIVSSLSFGGDSLGIAAFVFEVEVFVVGGVVVLQEEIIITNIAIIVTTKFSFIEIRPLALLL